MKKIIYLLFIPVLLFSCNTEEEIIVEETNEKLSPYRKKYKVCHSEKIKGVLYKKTIEVTFSELQDHLNHGDEKGPCEGEYTYIPDDSFEKYLINLGYDDVMDDYVLTSNISSITSFFYKDPWDPYGDDNICIGDFTGIEDFTALEGFGMWESNCLRELDLSKNSNLKSININEAVIGKIILPKENSSLESLTLWLVDSLNDLDLRSSENLNRIEIISAKKINYIDLSENTNLTNIWIGDLPKLNSMNLKNGNNRILEEVEISGVPYLRCVLVDDSSYSDANWRMDVDSQIAFESVYCPPIIDWPPPFDFPFK